MDIKNLFTMFRQVNITCVEKGETLIEKGGTKKEIFFIRKGLIRSYLTNEKSEEITFQLYPEYHIFGNVHSIFFNEPSKLSYHALEQTKVYMVDYPSFIEMASKNPKLSEFNRRYLGERVMRQAFQRVDSFVFLSPEERYEKYVKDYPNLINRAPDKYIANVLGITPVSLSRIRRRIASKKQ